MNIWEMDIIGPKELVSFRGNPYAVVLSHDCIGMIFSTFAQKLSDFNNSFWRTLFPREWSDNTMKS